MTMADSRDFATFAGHEFSAEDVKFAGTLHIDTKLTRDGHTTDIRSCGSTWGGERPKSLNSLMVALVSSPLDRRFMDYGKFASHNGDTWHFFGNFLELSHVFNITTDDPIVIETLRAAIRRNQHREDYRAQIVKVP